MRVMQFSDWHLGITSLEAIQQTIAKMKQTTDIDLIVACGDYTGSGTAPECVGKIFRQLRAAMPTTPIAAVLGNHDYWIFNKQKHPHIHFNRLEKIKNIFKDLDVYFLDGAPPLQINNYYFIGHSGWYSNLMPPTNDARYMIKMGEGIHAYMQATAKTQLAESINALPASQPGIEVVFVSHFNVINDGKDDWKGGFAQFGGDPSIGTFLQEYHDCKIFLHGHSHMLKQGPMVWEAGSDYYKPTFQVIDL